MSEADTEMPESQREFEVTAHTKTGIDVRTVEADSADEAESTVLSMDDVIAIEAGCTVEFDRTDDGRRVY